MKKITKVILSVLFGVFVVALLGFGLSQITPRKQESAEALSSPTEADVVVAGTYEYKGGSIGSVYLYENAYITLFTNPSETITIYKENLASGSKIAKLSGISTVTLSRLSVQGMLEGMSLKIKDGWVIVGYDTVTLSIMVSNTAANYDYEIGWLDGLENNGQAVHNFTVIKGSTLEVQYDSNSYMDGYIIFQEFHNDKKTYLTVEPYNDDYYPGSLYMNDFRGWQINDDDSVLVSGDEESIHDHLTLNSDTFITANFVRVEPVTYNINLNFCYAHLQEERWQVYGYEQNNIFHLNVFRMTMIHILT